MVETTNGMRAGGKPGDAGAAPGGGAVDGAAVDLATEGIEGLTPKQLGALGELVAASYLEHRGYDILEHGYRCPEGEADLIALDVAAQAVVLVEVKTRRGMGRADVSPEEAVDRRKRMRYRRIASCYLMDRFPVMSLRFDVIAVRITGPHDARIDHFHDVFAWEAES